MSNLLYPLTKEARLEPQRGEKEARACREEGSGVAFVVDRAGVELEGVDRHVETS